MWAKFARFWISVLLLCSFGAGAAYAQYFDLLNGRKKVCIKFKLVRNMVVIKLNINHKGPYNFIMDTGVGLMVITDPSLLDSLTLNYHKTIKLLGVDGKEEYEAVLTPPLNIDIPGMTSYGVGAAILTKDHFGLSNFAGIPIHGLLGYEFFNELAVKINFSDSTITACYPDQLRRLKKYTALPITIERNKPYLVTPIRFCDDSIRNCKLLADLGSGHALMLNSLQNRTWPITQYIAANLGIGLTGSIEGRIGRVKEIQLGKYKLSSVLSSFPDTTSLTADAPIPYDGNLGMYVLKKFTVIFNYKERKIYIKPGYNLKEPFEHDMSGMEYYAAGDDLKHIIIHRIEPGSPADKASLQSGDELTTINFKPVAKMSLEEIDELFRSKDGRNLVLGVYNNNKHENVIITLKRRI